jgi:hypothetical protein
MKICHCVKLTDEETKAFNTVRAVLDEMDNDIMLTSNFNGFDNVGFGDIRSWLDDVMDYINKFDS